MEQQKEYYAFISYKRDDKKEAKRLQHALEYYRLPNHLRQENPELPEYVRPVFRDMTDLEVGELSAQIHAGLEQSHFLIVVCSPRAAASKWVNDEVEYFISLGKQDKIIPYIIEGVPHASNPSEECYPPSLLNLSKEKELLGANINEVGKDSATIRVVSRMFSIRFDTLFQRYEREQKRKRWMWIGVSILIASLGLSIGGYFVRQNTKLEISQSHFIAEKAEQLMKEGDVFLAMRLLLTRTQSDLIIPEIEYGLRKAYNLLEEGTEPVSIIGAPFGKGGSYITNVNIEVTKDGSKYVYTKDKVLLVVCSFNGKTLFAKTWNDNIYNVELCNDDRYIVISDASGKAYVLDSSDGRILFTFVVGDKIVEDITANDKAGVIAICSGNKLRIWSYNGKQLRSFTFSEDIRSLKYHPNGSLIAVSNDNKVELYNYMANEIVHSMSHDKCCYDADFSSDGRLMSTCSDDSIVKVWNVSDGNMIRLFKLDNYVSTAIFDRTGTHVIAKSGYGSKSEIRLLNINEGSIGDVIRGQYLGKADGEPIIIEEFNSGRIYIYSPSSPSGGIGVPTQGSLIDIDFKGDKALISTTEGLTRLWYIGTDETSKVFGHSDYTKSPFHGKYMIRDVQMNIDGNIVATVGDDNLVKLWSYPEFSEIGTFIGHQDEPHTVRFSSDEKYIVSSSYDKTAIVWEVKTQRPIHIMRHEESVGLAEFINNDKNIMTISGHDVIIWSSHSGKQIRTMHFASTPIHTKELWESDGDDVIAAIYDENTNDYFVSYRDGSIRVWSFTGDIIKKLKAHNESAEICYSSKLNKLISWSDNGELFAWDFPSFKKTSLIGHTGDVHEAKLLHNGYELISSDDNGNVFLWDLRTGKMKRKLCSGTAGIQQFRISDNDKYLLALTDDNILKIISISDGALRMEYENPDFYECPIMSRNCNAIIAPLGDGWINVYKYPKFERLISDIQQLLQDVSLSGVERRKYLFE